MANVVLEVLNPAELGPVDDACQLQCKFKGEEYEYEYELGLTSTVT